MRFALIVTVSTTAAFLLVTSASLGQAPAPAPQPGADKAATARIFKDANELLTALETADKDLRSLTAEIRYKKIFAQVQGGDSQIREGKLTFVITPAQAAVPAQKAGADGKGGTDAKAAVPARRGFSVYFDSLVAGKQKRDEKRQFVFDGEWYAERDFANKQFTKRRIVAPGQQGDPLKIGEGPFPVPIGQAKADILNRFSAELVPFADGLDDAAAGRAFMQGTYQLKLTPREKSPEARNFKVLRLWYRQEDLLPRMALSLAPDDTATEILLINHARNMTADQNALNVDGPTEPGWVINVQSEIRGGVVEVKPAEGPGDAQDPAKLPNNPPAVAPAVSPPAPAAPATKPEPK